MRILALTLISFSLVFLSSSGQAQTILVPESTWVEPAAAIGNQFGRSLDLHGGTAIVGTLRTQVYIFERRLDGSWQHAKTLTSSSIAPAVAIDGHRAAIAADQGAGVVEIFERDEGGAGNWGQVAELVPMNAPPNTRLGASLSLSGDYLIAGSPQSGTTNTMRSGAALIFERQESGEWSQVTVLQPGVLVDGSYFGFDVALDGDLAIVGAPVNFDSGPAEPDTGAAFIFERIEGTWTEVRRLVPAAAQNFDYVGHAVDIDGETLVVGAWGAREPETLRVGAAYIFERRALGWLEIQELLPAHRRSFELFGHAVAISGDEVIVGEPRDYLATGSDTMSYGAAHLFRRDFGGADEWGRVARIESETPDPADDFASPVALDQGTALFGVALDNDAVFNGGSVGRLDTGNFIFVDRFESGDTSAWDEAIP